MPEPHSKYIEKTTAEAALEKKMLLEQAKADKKRKRPTSAKKAKGAAKGGAK